jgi:DNA helicase-2/ATP-dependent DNA helicase PcrA
VPDRAKFLAAFERFAGYRPYPAQERAIFADDGPLWILAGPGTGKTEVLVLRTLRLLLLDGVPPESIVLTTFTERAARNLHDRLSTYLTGIIAQPAFRGQQRPDIARIWLGTLHSVAHKMLLDMDDDVEGLELLDDTASLFVFLTRVTSKHTFGSLADQLYVAVTGGAPEPWEGRIERASSILAAINRVVEDNLDREALRAWRPLRGRKESWPAQTVRDTFLELLDAYESALGPRVDFARVQARLLEFLRPPRATGFLRGDDVRRLPGIKHVIIDECQDTNPIQEAIYFELARPSGNLVVVGDDDQALYRFRGASVDGMVNFRERCQRELGVSDIAMAELGENRRSHPRIVQAINDYVDAAASVARYASARTPKSALLAKSLVAGNHQPIVILVRDDEDSCAEETADAVAALHKNQFIEDYRQVALLAPSTRRTSQSPFSSYLDAFESRSIPVFNPRAKDVHKDQYLLAVLGALVTILDPAGLYSRGRLQAFVRKCRNALEALPGGDQLRAWVGRRSREYQKPALTTSTGRERYFDESLLDLYYKLTAHEPLRGELDATGGPSAALRSWRLGQLSGLIRGFEEARGGHNIPRSTTSSRQFFYRMRQTPPVELRGPDCWYVYNFIRDLMAAFSVGGLDDAEDDILAFPRGMVPALTIHQAKGLEFSIVFVCATRETRGPGAAHHQEDLFGRYRVWEPQAGFSASERAVHDLMRQYFVAFSRPKYSLVLCLERDVYDGILRGGRKAAAYPFLPASWLRTLPRV